MSIIITAVITFAWSMLCFMLGAEWQRAFWKPLLIKERLRNKNKQLKSLERRYNQTRPIVCGIDDRAENCTEEICDRLMSPITKKHLEPVKYRE